MWHRYQKRRHSTAGLRLVTFSDRAEKVIDGVEILDFRDLRFGEPERYAMHQGPHHIGQTGFDLETLKINPEHRSFVAAKLIQEDTPLAADLPFTRDLAR